MDGMVELTRLHRGSGLDAQMALLHSQLGTSPKKGVQRSKGCSAAAEPQENINVCTVALRGT